MRVLVIKMSSLGDVIHSLPALTDVKKRFPEVVFDWAVEPTFSEIPKLHSDVDKIITVPYRAWRKDKKGASFFAFIKAIRKQCPKEGYDMIIDAQGLLKSALLACCIKGKRVGYSWGSGRESWASLFYHKRVKVTWKQHAVIRARKLFAHAFGYEVPKDTPDYGLNKPKAIVPLPKLPYMVFLHGTTWVNKHWPEAYWRELAQIATSEGRAVLLPWGNEAEKVRAIKVAKDIPNAQVLPKLSLVELMSVLANAQGVVSVDTGLCHLTAALGTLNVSLYGPTEPKFSGAMGAKQYHLHATMSCAPCLKRTCQLKKTGVRVEPPCFEALNPKRIWRVLQNHLEIPIKTAVLAE